MRIRNVKNADELIIKYPNIVLPNSSEYKGKWKKYFKNDNPIYVERGMGKGQFIIKNALLNKDINYIGIEKVKEYYDIATRRMKSEQIKRSLI